MYQKATSCPATRTAMKFPGCSSLGWIASAWMTDQRLRTWHGRMWKQARLFTGLLVLIIYSQTYSFGSTNVMVGRTQDPSYPSGLWKVPHTDGRCAVRVAADSRSINKTKNSLWSWNRCVLHVMTDIGFPASVSFSERRNRPLKALFHYEVCDLCCGNPGFPCTPACLTRECGCWLVTSVPPLWKVPPSRTKSVQNKQESGAFARGDSVSSQCQRQGGMLHLSHRRCVLAFSSCTVKLWDLIPTFPN